jgi:hypothetical protein
VSEKSHGMGGACILVYWPKSGMLFLRVAASSNKVISILEENASFRNLSELLKKLRDDGNASHIAALANHSKHRSVVASYINEDRTGLAAECYTIKLAAFTYDEKQYPQIAINELLASECDRCSLLVIGIGNELNKVLCTG